METYTLVVLVALFLAVASIILMLERRRRSDLAQIQQLQQTLTACLGALQANQSSNEGHMAQLTAAVSQLQVAIQASTATSTESTQRVSADVVRSVEQATAKVSSVSQANSKELVERLEWFAKQVLAAVAATQTGIQTEAQRTTKAVESLKASLEESVKF